MTHRCPIAALALAATISLPSIANAQLAAHRAVYEIDLADASERSGIKGMSGRMVYDFGGSSCDGYTTSFRFVTRIETENDSRLTDQQTTTFENVEDGVFQFATRSFVDDSQDKDIEGVANLDEGGIEVTLSSPEDLVVELPETSFPTQHLIELLDVARDGERFFERDLFDGSDDADEIMNTSAVSGEMRRHEDDANVDDKDGEALPIEFNGLRYWPVTIAYYSASEERGEELPLYRIEMKLYENGVSRDLSMDYGEFQLSGTLSDIELREADRCD